MDSTNAYEEKKDFQTALVWVQKALSQAEKEFGKLDTNYLATLSIIPTMFYNLNKIDSAVSYQEINLQLFRNLFKSDHPDVAMNISNLGYLYYTKGKLKEAEPLFKEALEMRKRLMKGDDFEYAGSLNNLASLYQTQGRLNDAESLYREALEIQKRLFKGDNPNVAMSINNLAVVYKDQGRINDAESLYKESLDMRRRLFKGDHPYIAAGLNNLGYLYQAQGRLNDAEPLFIEALDMRKRLFKGDNPNVAISINNLATLYDDQGRFNDAEPLYKESLEIRRRLFKGDHPDIAISLHNLGELYKKMGRLNDAESLFKESLEMNERIYKNDHPYIVLSLNNLAGLYQEQGKLYEVEHFYKKALEMSKRLYKEKHPNVALSLQNLAGYYKVHGRLNEAEPLSKEALEMYKSIFKSDHPSIATGLNNLASLYQAQERLDDAEPLFIESLEMRRRLFREEHPDVSSSLNNLAFLYRSQGRIYDAESYFIQSLDAYRNHFLNNYVNLSEKEKESFWNTIKIRFLNFNTFVTDRYNENPNLLKSAYNNLLFIKGLLLSSTIKIRNNIMNSGDKVLMGKFNDWLNSKKQLAKLYSMTNIELVKKGINLDSIINDANEREKELCRLSEIFSKEINKKQYNSEDVQNQLTQDEAAVEIVRFKYYDKSRTNNTIYYAALILKKYSKHPEFVLLKNGYDLETKYIKNYKRSISNKVEDKDSYTQFWEPIAKKLKGIKKVYISPDGVYNQINLATLMNPKTEHYLSDELDIRIVTSTRDLVERHTPESPLKRREIPLNPPLEKGERVVELFGDPLFNLDSTKHLELASTISENRTRDFYFLGNTLDSTTRGGIRPLPSTRTEIEQIANEFTKKGWEVNSHLGEKALEEAVKGVDNPKVLHIATHGKFLKDIEIKNDDRMMGMETKRVTENPLLRSFLLFSGAENTLNNQKLDNQKTDDGLLTAYEAMNLNLDKTELVVLSACETGLGEIKNGEGVYGLQRAFQQAGAKTIIMSLWTVPDKETQELMTSCYSKWLNGKDKRTAFNEARNEMRDKYHFPYYWGGFVMVGE